MATQITIDDQGSARIEIEDDDGRRVVSFHSGTRLAAELRDLVAEADTYTTKEA